MNWIETTYVDAIGDERPIYINLAQVRYIKQSGKFFTLVVFTQSQQSIKVLMRFQDFIDAIDNQEPQAAANAASTAASPPTDLNEGINWLHCLVQELQDGGIELPMGDYNDVYRILEDAREVLQ